METLKELLNETSFHILSYHQGIVKEIKSKKIIIEINPYCLVRDDSQLFEKVFYVMLCNPSTLVYISINDIYKVIHRSDGTIENWTYKESIGVYSSGKCKRKNVLMHRVLKNAPNRCNRVEHINGRKYDNRHSNLRFHCLTFTDVSLMPESFRDWYIVNRRVRFLPRYCYYCYDNVRGRDYFVIDVCHPVLRRLGVMEEIGSGSDKFSNLVERYLCIERLLNLMDLRTDWNNAEISLVTSSLI